MAGEQKLGPKKRKRQSLTTNHGFFGIFTRSKSQIYVHRNRSGRARLDSLPRHLNVSRPLPCKPRRRVLAQDSADADDLSRMLIKDLRTRRVFSNGFVLGGENEEEKGSEKGTGISKNRSSCKSLFDRNVVDTNVSEDGDNNEKLDLGLGSKDVNLNPSLLQKERRGDEEFDVSNGVAGLDEETLQSTPPDIEVLIDTKEDENGGQKAEFVREKQSNENINKRNSNNFKIKSVKLFKAPGSFSYRRLLPYLMDISEDKSFLTGGPKMGQSQKLEKGREEKPYSTSQNVDILINKSMRESCDAESNDVDRVNKPKSASTACIKESPKKPSMDGDFSHTSISMVEEWSKPIMDWGIERFNIKSSRQEPNLGMNNMVSAISDDTKSMGNGETAKIDVYKSSDPQIMINLGCSLSLAAEICNSGKDSEDGQCFEDKTQSKSERVYESNEGGPSEVNNLNHTNVDLPNRERTENLSDAEQRDDGGGEVLGHIDNSNKEYVQMTPPVDDVIGKLEVVATGCNSMICMHNFLGKPLNGSTDGNNNSIDDKTICSSPMRKQVLNRCSRLKLFKAPGSLGYRRMLPFLMDVVKDNSSASGKGHLLKLEKSFEANPISPSLVSNCQEMPIENSNGNECHAEHQTGGHSALPLAVKTSKSNNQEHGNESPKTSHPQQERDANFEQDISDAAIKLETGPEVMDIIHGCGLSGTSFCSLSSSRSLREDAEHALQASSLNLEEDCNKSVTEVTNDAKQTETESFVQDSSNQANSLCLTIPATVSNKGILRRTPRGCRGLCTCLNCSSFRLHAEKAFDFSRNQMLDSEEVVLDLIKELSYVRNRLEKSTFSPDGHALVCASQVKEACIRTREAEELAQSRLSQMNFDLDIHSRVTCAERPRVTFANYVKEKIITNSELPSRYRLIEAEKEEKLC